MTGQLSRARRLSNSIEPVEPKAEFVVPQKGSVILPEAITPKADKAEEATEEAPAEAEAEAAEEAAE